ncbi:MAG: uncharacterized membrane protein YjgN (DUF898 family) [Halocynthiibacter sp.]|jgi:uncharacterized membrane protein YjgN (DUF898 family)
MTSFETAAAPGAQILDGATGPVAGKLVTDYAGDKGHMFGLAFRTGALTVLTFGFYRFWMKTKLRRYYWSSIRPGGVPLEYTGQGIEKLLGFLVAVVVMAFYIGIVNLLLMFASFAIFHGNVTAYVLSFVGVLPIVFFAQYRARRYILARTRWRGIRFGLEPGAWGYSFRALGYWLLAIGSLGLLWPLKTFRLEKYRIDHTYFGDQKLHQGGRFTMLYRPFLQVLIPGYISLGLLVWLYAMSLSGVEELGFVEIIAALVDFGEENSGADYGFLRAQLLHFITVPWMLVGMLHYSVQAFRIMAAHKSAGPIRFESKPRTGRMFWIYLSGFTLSYLVFVCGIGAVIFLGFVFALIMMGDMSSGVALEESLRMYPLWLTTGVSILVYFTIFILWQVFKHVFVTLPTARHYAETLTLFGTDEIGLINQRARDEFAEAEGFADALDLGAAI